MRKVNYNFKKSNICIYVSSRLSKNPKVFLHGFTGSYKSWYDITKKIKDYILIDIPGHGNSYFIDSASEYNFSDWVNDFAYIIKDLNINRVKLIGYSLGARLSIVFASTTPELINSLILESSGYGLDNKEERDDRYQKDIKLANLIEKDFDKFLVKWEENPLFKNQKNRNPVAYQKQKAIRIKQKPNQLSRALKSFSQGKMKSYLKNFKKFDFPIVLINGDEDKKYITLSEVMFHECKNINHYIISKSGHNVHLENSENFLKVLMRHD